MRLARPSTIWRAISVDLWRLLVISAGVVVCVGVFAVTLRPLAEGKIGPAEALNFMGFAALPMLQYALPFAAGFAATMAYHRMATDNELVASHAGGISHGVMLVPAGIAGVVLAGLMLLLTDTAIPRLLRNMEEVVTANLVRVVIAPIKRGEAISLGPRVQVFADDVAVPPTPPPTPPGPSGSADAPAERYVLSGALAVEFDEKGNVLREASARTAYLWVYRGEESEERGGGVTVVLNLEDSLIRAPGQNIDGERAVFNHKVPSLFIDDPKYYSWRELERIKREPERMNWILRQKRVLAGLLSEKALAETISERLERDGKVRFLDDVGREVLVRARRLGDVTPGKGWTLAGGGAGAKGSSDAASVEVMLVLGEGRAWRYVTSKAWLSASSPAAGATAQAVEEAAGTMNLRMEDFATSSVRVDPESGAIVTSADAGGDVTTQIRERTLTGLRPFDVPAPGEGQTVAQLLKAAEAVSASGGGGGGSGGASRIVKAREDLAKKVGELGREIFSKQQQRLATSVACVVMVLCGAIMAMRLRESLPLPVYLWSFLPGLGTILTISSGQKMTHNMGWPGMLLLWGGVAGLGALAFAQYRKLTKH